MGNVSVRIMFSTNSNDLNKIYLFFSCKASPELCSLNPYVDSVVHRLHHSFCFIFSTVWPLTKMTFGGPDITSEVETVACRLQTIYNKISNKSSD
jgi:hypothetical protein